MTRTPAAAVATACAILCGCVAPPGPVRHTPTAKLDSRLLHDARRADVLGLTPTASLNTRPPARGDIFRAYGSSTLPDESDSQAEAVELTPDQTWFAAYVASYETHIDDQWDETEHQSTFFTPVDDARLRVVVVDETVNFYNEQGREFEKGLNVYASNRATARLANRFVITADPELSYVEKDGVPGEDESVNLRFHELTLSSRFGPLELTVGRQPLWWGPGRHGSLLLSNNARPFDMVKLSSAGPVLLPGFLSYLGLIRGELFATLLEDARAVPHPVLAGMRVTSRVRPWLEVGASRTMQFGGKGRSVTGRTIWEVLTASTENDKDDPGNQIASIEARIIVPWSVQPFELYAEYGGEDEAGGFFSREAYLAGFYLPRFGPSRRFEFTFEYMDNTVRDHDRTWYTNNNYPDGYTYHNVIIGHHAGTDAQDIFAELKFHPPLPGDPDVSLTLSYDYEEHFRLDPTVERLHQIRAGAEINTLKRLKLLLQYQHDIWENFRQDRGQNETGNALTLGAHWEF